MHQPQPTSDPAERILDYLVSAAGSPGDPGTAPLPFRPDAAERALIRDVLEAHQAMLLKGYHSGPMYFAIVRFLMSIRDRIERDMDEGGSKLAGFCNAANVIAYGFRALPRVFWPRLGRLAVRLMPGKQPARRLRAAIYSRKIPMGPLLAVADDVTQPADCYAYLRDRPRNVVVGTIVGVDVIRSNGRWAIIESNTGIGQKDQWTPPMPENPFIDNMVGFASEHGFRGACILNNDRGLHVTQDASYRQAAKRHAIEVEIVEPASVPSTTRPRSAVMPPLDAPDTLHIRIRDFPSWADFALSDKRHVHQTLSAWIDAHGIEDVFTPDSSPGWLDRVDWSSGRFPNLVCKLPDADKGVGIAFYKARDKAHAIELTGRAASSDFRIGGTKGALTRRAKSGDRILQAYVPGDVGTTGHLEKYRIELLVTPIGCKMLAAGTVTAPKPLPESLDYGVVMDPFPYLANAYPGSECRQASAADLRELEPVAEIIGRALADDLERHFRTEAAGTVRPDA